MELLEPGVQFYQIPDLKEPCLVAGWPGIGNIGLGAVSYFKEKIGAREFAEIEPESFFFPHGILVRDGVIQEMEFPKGKFFYHRAQRDLIIFLGEAQPREEEKIYKLANLVLNVAQRFGVKRVYTAAAAVAPVHHTSEPKVWGVPNNESLIKELKRYDVVLMSEIEERGGSGNITGLNGLLPGVARERNMEGICLLGEIPPYIAQFPLAYPKASKAILNVLTQMLGVKIDFLEIESYTRHAEREIERLYDRLPLEVRDELDKLKSVPHIKQAGRITEEDKRRIMKDVEEFFKKQDKQS